MTKFKFLLFAVLLFAALFTACEKDDQVYSGAKQFGPTIEAPIVYLEGERAKEAINLLNREMDNPRARQKSRDWSINLDEILLVTDTLGN